MIVPQSQHPAWRHGGIALLALLALASPVLGAPDTTPPGASAAEGGDPRVELERQLLELRKDATVSAMEVVRLRQEVESLRAELEAAQSACDGTVRRESPVMADDLTAGEAETIEGATWNPPPGIEVEELEEELLAPAPIQASQAPFETPQPEPGNVPAGTDPTGSAPETPPLDPIAANETPTEEALALYDEGYTLFHQRDYSGAEVRFQQYVDRYPTTDLADNAQFWIGECRLARGEFAAALEAFATTVERYPESNKLADAILQAGKCLAALGETAEAEESYRQVMERFPNSVAASSAREALEALSRRP